MFGVERDTDADICRVWHMVQELSEQLAHNQKLVVSLQSQAGTLKGQVLHNGTGYTLRRFNVDLSQEEFESELERVNAQTIIENQTLVHENRQLSGLLKNYEETLDTVMSKFRNHSLAAQQHEFTITRHYEMLMLSRETNSMNPELSNNTHVNASLQRLSQNLRMLLRSLGGEDMESPSNKESGSLEEFSGFLDDESREDWAVEREREITRLDAENAELRRIAGHRRGQRGTRPMLHILRSAVVGPQDSPIWNVRSPPTQMQPFGVGPPSVPGNAGPVPQQNMNIPLQRTIEFQPGMRAAGTQRGRGNGPFWGPTPPQERQWLARNGGLDLAG
ncbi:hypothetical protein DFH11DRAFT_1685296 [Phellopilus nigrolimitatus]|nr:hypothetical protein DFH11DRAFT_1685296 [Phellopilus nigrolimitatus]